MSDNFEVVIGTVPLRNYQMPIPSTSQYNVPQVQSPTQQYNVSQMPAPGIGFVIPSAVPMEEPSAPAYSELRKYSHLFNLI